MQEIVIKIPNSLYANLKKIKGDSIAGKRVVDCVINGTVLPKGHGRLIDADEIENYMLPSEKQDKKTWFVHSGEYRNAVIHFNHAMRLLRDNAPTIIEADRSEESEE